VWNESSLPKREQAHRERVEAYSASARAELHADFADETGRGHRRLTGRAERHGRLDSCPEGD